MGRRGRSERWCAVPEFITIQRAGGQKQVLNLSLITRCVVHFDGGSATVNFDIDSIEIHGRSEVKQLMDGIARASEAAPAPAPDFTYLAEDRIRNRLINLAGELMCERSEAGAEYVPGLNRAIDHIRGIVKRCGKTEPALFDTGPSESAVLKGVR